jgi:hypothetical protein
MGKGTIVLADVNLGEILWSLLVLYLMFMYFLVVIIVILDMFRSDDLSGWAKALWCVALIVFPIISLLVYLVMRGDGIGLRNLARERRASDAVPPPPPPPPAALGPASELEKAKGMLDSGVISQAEFDTLKAKVLG